MKEFKSLPTLDQLFLQRELKDAKAKVEALPNRLKDEFQQAAAEGRAPFSIEPLTGIRADLVVWACDAAGPKAKPEVADIIAVQRKSCGKLGQAEVFLRSDQLLPLLMAAGVTEGSNAPVQG